MTEGGDPLLATDEPPALEVVNACGAGSAVVVCDHASNRVPRRLAGLGLVPAQLVTHIAWDPGAEEVARRVAEQLDAPLVVSGYSRLVIDCNRPLESEESIAVTSAGMAVPGNCAISSADRALRAAALFRPYHRAIAEVLNQRSAARRRSLLLSIHSFTPVLNGDRRPWQVAMDATPDWRYSSSMRSRPTARWWLATTSRTASTIVPTIQSRSMASSGDYRMCLSRSARTS